MRATPRPPPGRRARGGGEFTLAADPLAPVLQLPSTDPPIPPPLRKPATTAPTDPTRFVVSIGRDVPPGLYDVRAVGRFGITNPRVFLVSASPELVAKPGNTNAAATVDLPRGAAIHATAEANATQFYRLSLHRGERLRLDAWTAQL